ncbi:MAG TPA: hypothetical protein VF331_21810 [Polyangiales bacterium]
MTALILHHYEMSPFSEKVRRISAWKHLRWQDERAGLVFVHFPRIGYEIAAPK